MAGRSWNQMSYDVLLKIFTMLNMVELSTVSLVCGSWRRACQDSALWDGKVFDLSDMTLFSALNSSSSESNDDSSASASAAAGRASSSRLTQFLKCALDLSCGKISCFIFNFHQSINDDDLLLVAERTANLKRLVLPRWNKRLTRRGVQQAMQLWRGLESLTIVDISRAYRILKAIGEHCKNFRELKVSSDFSTSFARSLIKLVPNLKVLSLQSTLVIKNGLVLVTKDLKHLETLNVSHSVIVGFDDDDDDDDDESSITVVTQHDVRMLVENNDSGITTLITCEGLCGMCIQVLEWDIGSDEWKNRKEDVWREDEIASLQF